jgi:hypothetical protein
VSVGAARYGLAALACVSGLVCAAAPGSSGGEGALTPVGAERAGNADGSIPAWEGGLTSPPPGWKPAMGYIDPFAGETPLFVISGANAEQHAARLSPGQLAMLKRHADFRMPVYPSHRTAALPKEVTERVRAQAGKAALNGFGLVNPGRASIPFPAPKNGLEAIWNHLVRYLGKGVERSFHSFAVRPSGDFLNIGFHDTRVYDENFDESMENRLFSYIGYFTSPPELRGTIYLVHEPVDQVKESRKAWVYNAGQRRVRRAPDLSYDNSQDGSDGLAVVDQYDGYNGAPDRYDWTLVGKKELYVSYNNYKIGDKKIPYQQVVKKTFLNPELTRYELHRVWVVEARLKAGQAHIYPRRVFYLDEDSWSVLQDDAYDTRGQLWRTGTHGLVQFYDASVPWYRFESWNDLSNGAYVVTGLDNESNDVWTFGAKAKMINFQPDALRRMGK